MTIPSFLRNAQPIEFEEEEGNIPSFLQNAQKVEFEGDNPTNILSKAKIFTSGVVEGVFGAGGDLQDLVGRGMFYALNKLTGNNVDYDESKKELEKRGMPVDQIYQQIDQIAFKDNDISKLSAIVDSDEPIPRERPPLTTEFAERIIADATGGATIPQNSDERILKGTGQFFGNAIAPIAPLPSKFEALGALGGGLLMATGEEAGMSPLGQLGLAIGGSIATQGLAKGIVRTPRAITSAIRNPKKALATALNFPFSPFRVKPDQIRKAIIDSAKKEGIDLPLSAVIDNSTLRLMETQLVESGLTGEVLENARKKMANQFVTSFKENLESISDMAFQTRADAGEFLSRSLNQAEKKAKAVYDNLYEIGLNRIPDNATVIPKKLAKTVNNAITRLSDTPRASEGEKKTLQILRDIRRDLFDGDILRPMRVKRLYNFKRSLNDTVDFDVQGTSQQFLKKLIGDVKEELQLYERQNPLAVSKLKEADRVFADYAETYRNNDIKNAIFSQNPEQVANFGNSISKYRKVERALRNDPEALNAFRRNQLEFLLTDKFISPNDQTARFRPASTIFNNTQKKALIKEIATPDEVKRIQSSTKNALSSIANAGEESLSARPIVRAGQVGKMANNAIKQSFQSLENDLLKDPKKLAFTRAVIGDETFKRIERLRTIADGIVQGAEKFANPSKSGVRVLDIALLLQVAKDMIKSITTLNPLPMMKAGFGISAPRFLARAIIDPEFIGEMIRLAELGKGKNQREYLKQLAIVSKSLLNKLNSLSGEEGE